MSNRDSLYLLKFFLVSAGSFFIGTLHGMIQVLPPIRAWLKSIGTPLTNPGHMIDPLAHAHINLVGGLAIFSMGVIYYFISKWNDGQVFSRKWVNVSFWCTTVGVGGFYTAHLFFGITEGHLMLAQLEEQRQAVHRFYGPTISVFATIMAGGFLVYAANVFFTTRQIFKKS